MIDTENNSGDFYANLCEYDVGTITAPYDVRKYLIAIQEAEKAGYDVLIIDSLSHAWSGEGGLLDVQGKIADSSKSGNSFTAWRQVTPWHNKLINTILTSKCHVIATMRSKMDYIQVQNDKGKTEIKKVGLAPIQREGIEYEFGTVFDLNTSHLATVSKDRTSLFDGKIFQLSEETGQVLKKWLNSDSMECRSKKIYNSFLEKFDGNEEQAKSAILGVTNGRGSKDWTEEDIENLENAV